MPNLLPEIPLHLQSMIDTLDQNGFTVIRKMPPLTEFPILELLSTGLALVYDQLLLFQPFSPVFAVLSAAIGKKVWIKMVNVEGHSIMSERTWTINDFTWDPNAKIITVSLS